MNSRAASGWRPPGRESPDRAASARPQVVDPGGRVVVAIAPLEPAVVIQLEVIVRVDRARAGRTRRQDRRPCRRGRGALADRQDARRHANRQRRRAAAAGGQHARVDERDRLRPREIRRSCTAFKTTTRQARLDRRGTRPRRRRPLRNPRLADRPRTASGEASSAARCSSIACGKIREFAASSGGIPERAAASRAAPMTGGNPNRSGARQARARAPPRVPRRAGRPCRRPSATSTPGRTPRRGTAARQASPHTRGAPRRLPASIASGHVEPDDAPCAGRFEQPQIAARSRAHVERARRGSDGVDQRLDDSPARPPSADCEAAADRSRPTAHSPRAAAAAVSADEPAARARRRSESTRCMSETRRFRTLIVHQPLQRAQLVWARA